jgi:RHS repeat-associated protein
LTGVSFGVSGKTSESSIGYEYDEADRLIEVNDSAGGEYTLGYDSLDRLTSAEGPNGNVGYEYDDAGRRELMEVPGGTVGYEYDNANRLTELTSGGLTVLLSYDKANRLDSLTLPNGIEQLYAYDKASQATSMAYRNGESNLGEINYAYDASGRTEAMWGSYARLGLPEALKSTKYNAANALVEREGKKLTYDADGNLTGDGSDEYTWNARGQLSKISGVNTASFGYDPFGRRASKTLGGTATKLLFDGPNVIQESIEGEITADLLTGLAADEIFSRTTKAGTSSYLTNALNSTIALTNGSAEVKTTYAYDPFGGMTKVGEATDNPYQFTGRENDGTGLQYNRARYYSSLMARFISRDPARFVDGANLYWYAFANPGDFSDPTGEVFAAGGCCLDAADLVSHGERTVADLVNKIGDWGGCEDEVSSESGSPPNWPDVLGNAGVGGSGGGGLVGAARDAAIELWSQFDQEWLRSRGCGRWADALEFLSKAADAFDFAGLVGMGGTPIPMHPPNRGPFSPVPVTGVPLPVPLVGF